MAFKIEIRDPQTRKTLTFGPRSPGQIGKDILAVKIALGLIERLTPNGVSINEEELVPGAPVPMDKQQWFNCQTQIGTDVTKASTFDLDMQSVLKKYQIDNSFLILSYFFEKRCIPDIVQYLNSVQEYDAEEYAEKVNQQEFTLFSLFEVEFGQLGEATLSVMHGWRPHSTIDDTGFTHPRNVYGNQRDPVVDIVPKSLVDYIPSTLGRWQNITKKLMDTGYVMSTNPSDPLLPSDGERRYQPSIQENNLQKLYAFKNNSRSFLDWVRLDGSQNVPFEYYSVDYIPTWSNTSRLLEPTKQVLSSTEEFEDATLLDPKTREDRMKTFFYPDAFSTDDPFIIDSKKIGFFFETEYEIASDKFPSDSRETIQELEEAALVEILEFYQKPKIWNFIKNDSQFNSIYFNNNVDQNPSHSGLFPIEIDEERIKNSSAYRATEFKISLLEQRKQRLQEKLIPTVANRHLDMEEQTAEINERIQLADSEIEELKRSQERILSGEQMRKSDFWVLSTSDIMSQLPQGAIQSWRTVESSDTAPLIKFIEFRTPPLRPGMKYRALMEINREKLDLIIYGDNPGENQQSQQSQALVLASSPESDELVKVCVQQNAEQARRTYQEMVAHAQKRRRELSRSLKEVTSTRDTSRTTPNIDLGIFGPYNFNKAFGALHGLSGITNDYEYTQKAIKLLVDTAGVAGDVLEKFNIGDTTSEEFQQAIDEGLDKSEKGDRDSKKYNRIYMPWKELKERIKTASDDLSEAAKVIESEGILFVRGSNYKPESEAELLRRTATELDELVGDDKFTANFGAGSDRKSISELADLYAEDEIIIAIDFAPLDYTGLGPKNGKTITQIKVLVQEKNWFDFDSGLPRGIYSTFIALNVEAMKKYEALSRPRTANYLSYVYSMTNPYPSSFGSFVKSFWDDGRGVCDQLGINSDKGLAISIVGNYTSGIQIDLSKDDDRLVEAFKDWSKKNFVNPTKKWLEQSGRNAVESLNDTFDEDAALKAFGKLCTLEDLYKEFMDKLDLKSLLCDYLKCLKLPAFEFKLPSFYLPPFPKIPIIGWYGYLVYFIIKNIKQILIRILCTFARTIIDKLAIPFCEEQLEDFISAGSSATPIMNRALAEALTNTGITSGNEQRAKEFFDDAANLTTGRELCRLLEGQPLDAAAMQMLRRLVEKRGLSGDLDTDEAIINYFGVVGSFVPADICEQLSSLPTSDELDAPGGQVEKCDDILSALAAIRNRLLSNDPSLTNEEIDAVLDIQKKNLNDKKAQIDALSGAGLESMLPPEFRPGSQENQNNIINSMPTFLAGTMQQAAEGMFTTAKSSYISGLTSYVQSMKIRGPVTPDARDSDYDYDSTLRLEAALEQIKNYTSLMDVNPAGDDAGARGAMIAADIGLVEKARLCGLGDWSSPDAYRRNANLSFLDQSRDLNNPEIRQENQNMINSLLKKEFLNTLKVKQIISAFTIFENFGHDPLAAAMKWAREINIKSENYRNPSNDSSGEKTRAALRKYGLSDWWRVRPSGIGDSNDGSLKKAYDFVQEQIDKGFSASDWVRHGTENAIRNFTLVTQTLQETDWYTNWAGDEHPNPTPTARMKSEKIKSLSTQGLSIEDQNLRLQYVRSFFTELDQINPISDLEIFCQTSNDDQFIYPLLEQMGNAGNKETWSTALERNRRGSILIGAPLILNFKGSAPNSPFHVRKINEFLDNIVSSFYERDVDAANPLGDPIPMREIYGTLSDSDFGEVHGKTMRKKLFFGPVGNPLFLTNDNNGREFIPYPTFGVGIMTNFNEFEESIRDNNNRNYDIFLPLENIEDFLLTNPESPRQRGDSFVLRPMKNNVPSNRSNVSYSDRGMGGSYLHIEEGEYPALFDAPGSYPGIDDYTDVGAFFADAFHVGSMPSMRSRGYDATSSRWEGGFMNILPVNSYPAIVKQTAAKDYSNIANDVNMKYVFGHPFHRRAAYGFEEIEGMTAVADDDNLPFLTFPNSVGPIYKSDKIYNGLLYGPPNSAGQSEVNTTSHWMVAVAASINDDGTPQLNAAQKMVQFSNSTSEFSVMNRANYVYRTKPMMRVTVAPGYENDYETIGVWNPFMSNREDIDILGLGHGPEFYDRDTQFRDGRWDTRGDNNYSSDYLNPVIKAKQMTGFEANTGRPYLSAKDFFMLPNRIMQALPGHYTRPGYRSGDANAVNGAGPVTFDAATGYTEGKYIEGNTRQKMGKIVISNEEMQNPESDAFKRRDSYLKFLYDRRYLMNEQLYMKIVKLLSWRYIDDGLPMVNKYLLRDVMMSALKERIETLELAMIVYGTKNNFEHSEISIFSDIELAPPYGGGYSNPANVEITPEKVKTLFTTFQTEAISITDGTGVNYVHKRFYRDQSGREQQIGYREFIDIIKDPLGTKWPTVIENGQRKKVEFYLKPFVLGEGDTDSLLDVNDFEMQYENDQGERKDINDRFLRLTLGNGYSNEFISKDVFYIQGSSIRSLNARDERIAKDTFLKTSKMLLLDEDRDNLIEIAKLNNLNLTTVEDAYINAPALLDIASERIQTLSAMIVEIMENQNQTFDFQLLPTISSAFSMIKQSHPDAGLGVNNFYNGNTAQNSPEPRNIGIRFGMGPYTPGVKMVELPVDGQLGSDRYNLVVDSDINLGLSFKKIMTNRSESLDRGNSDSMLQLSEETEKFRKIFSFCEELPNSLKEVISGIVSTSESPKEARRVAFRELVKRKILENGLYNHPDNNSLRNPGEIRELEDILENEVFNGVVSNILREMEHSLENSPMFEEEYADQVSARVSGKAIVKQSSSGRCVSNRYSLDSSSILSFKKVIIGDVSEEVMKEMRKPENSPFNRDFGKPEPFDKAMKTIAVKSFIRLCLVDLLLKGGIAYSVWDIEPIITSPVFIEYAKEHVRLELEKSKPLRSIWGSTLESSESISNKLAALEVVVVKEIGKLPGYSKQIFNPNSQEKDYYNWHIYGKTVFDGEDIPQNQKDNKFFTKQGILYRTSVPSRNPRTAGTKIFRGNTHLGNFDGRTGRLNQEINLTRARYNSTGGGGFISGDKQPTSKIYFEDYFKCSGEIINKFKAMGYIHATASSLDEYVFTHKEVSEALLHSASGPASVIANSRISIGVRLTLNLWHNHSERLRSRIQKVIKNIHDAPESENVSNRQRAYAVSVPNPLDGSYHKYFVATIPLASYEKDLSLEDCQEVFQFLTSDPISPRNEAVVPSDFYLRLSQDFAETQGFKDFLDHIFPMRRYLATSSIFASSVLGGFNEVPTIMSPAKSMVAFIALVCATPPAERQNLVQMDQADWAKQSREKSPGDMNEGECFEFPGISEEFFREFYKELLRIMYYFPSILFRGIANVLDPAYKEMRNHYMNCDIRDLNWRGVAGYSTKSLSNSSRNVLTNGLLPGQGNGPEPNGKYASLIPASIIDMGIGFAAMSQFNFSPLLQATLKTVAYIYSGQLPFLDLSAAFKVPCADIDEDWKKGEKYDAGRFGRYGHPISPFTVLALSTLQLPADIDKRRSGCGIVDEDGNEEQFMPDADCDEDFEE